MGPISQNPEKPNSSNVVASEKVGFVVKVIIVGDWGVGKTSLIRRFAENKFDHDYKPSIGVNIVTKVVDVAGRKLKLQLFDTGGQERFQSLRQRYYKGANAVIFVFDITRPSSASAIESKWLDEVKSILGEDFVRAVLANKTDLDSDRAVSEYAAQQATDRIQGKYYETSALDGRNVTEAFSELAAELMEKLFPEV
ncbi:MAG: Rab family GTPase [Candidatus Thorarchaeota archaeon]